MFGGVLRSLRTGPALYFPVSAVIAIFPSILDGLPRRYKFCVAVDSRPRFTYFLLNLGERDRSFDEVFNQGYLGVEGGSLGHREGNEERGEFRGLYILFP